MGMLATVINALALQDALEQQGCYTRVMSAIKVDQISEPYIRRRAIRHLEKGQWSSLEQGQEIHISTDTGAALRAAEIHADVILKGTKVDGVYTKDPVKHEDAVLIPQLNHMEMLSKNLRVMDATAASLCMDNNLPIIVFNLHEPGNIHRIVMGEKIGTRVLS